MARVPDQASTRAAPEGLLGPHLSSNLEARRAEPHLMHTRSLSSTHQTTFRGRARHQTLPGDALHLEQVENKPVSAGLSSQCCKGRRHVRNAGSRPASVGSSNTSSATPITHALRESLQTSRRDRMPLSIQHAVATAPAPACFQDARSRRLRCNRPMLFSGAEVAAMRHAPTCICPPLPCDMLIHKTTLARRVHLGINGRGCSHNMAPIKRTASLMLRASRNMLATGGKPQRAPNVGVPLAQIVHLRNNFPVARKDGTNTKLRTSMLANLHLQRQRRETHPPGLRHRYASSAVYAMKAGMSTLSSSTTAHAHTSSGRVGCGMVVLRASVPSLLQRNG